MLDEIFQDIAPILLKSSPMIATMLGSPVAGLVVSLISHIFETDPKKPADLVSKIMDDVPSATMKLQDAESEYGECLKYFLSWRQPTALEASIKVQWDAPK